MFRLESSVAFFPGCICQHRSGLGTVEHAIQYINKAFAVEERGVTLHAVSSLDRDTRCREHLKRFQGHVFGNVMDMLPADTVKEVRRLERDATAHERVLQVIEDSDVKPKMTCYSCSKNTKQCEPPYAFLDVSGSPCPDWSRAGKNKGVKGKHMSALKSFGKYHRRRRTWIARVILSHAYTLLYIYIFVLKYTL
jgi:site-specific DNA-cytosine methylase